jgi:hypothetical protein
LSSSRSDAPVSLIASSTSVRSVMLSFTTIAPPMYFVAAGMNLEMKTL